MKSRQPLTECQNGANSGGETRKMGETSLPCGGFFVVFDAKPLIRSIYKRE